MSIINVCNVVRHQCSVFQHWLENREKWEHFLIKEFWTYWKKSGNFTQNTGKVKELQRISIFLVIWILDNSKDMEKLLENQGSLSVRQCGKSAVLIIARTRNFLQTQQCNANSVEPTLGTIELTSLCLVSSKAPSVGSIPGSPPLHWITCSVLYHGSHMDWKTWKSGKFFSSQGILNRQEKSGNFTQNTGKLRKC